MKGPARRGPGEWRSLDRDLERVSVLEAGAIHLSRPLLGAGISLVFIVLSMLIALLVTGREPGMLVIVAAAALAAYMALNIGANDVANNMGPAVGSGALPMAWAIALAVVCESAGALVAGSDVVETLSRGILQFELVSTSSSFAIAMIAALLGAAIWVNVATWIGAPVSTTQAVIGGMIGAAAAAGGLSAMNWPTLGLVALGWVVSPLLGALVAALLLALIKWRILDAEDKIAAARRWLPRLIGLMAGAFTAYLLLKLPVRLVTTPLAIAPMALAAGALAWRLSIPAIRARAEGLENRRASLKVLFRLPLVISAALLSFAHGANDVANAVGPLAALVEAQRAGVPSEFVSLPFWVLVIGAAGISVGLMLFGPRLIRMVGHEITRLNPTRAFCVALSAAVTVILASALGLPVSSTHIAIGGVFGVGFFREWFMQPRSPEPGRRYPAQERRRRRLVRRSHFMTIIGAWVVTLPCAALLSAFVFTVIRLVAGLG
ncbi:inorganic phosphate transporter, PiT family [Pseudooceanicola antarcticus]|uniref:Phosphate transporter n=1 Tax=Pseudooceanicola antarcticus TaxID=1247613 RepID=A0A285JAQ9_9RHOB|nr:inorganic phosphate transporter [Pseudooceanicola antarcticus]PJE30812.1 inorganic phosphate transporter [Pseudooceanicola antarcticus]SNY57173.1 inorganic phosphate transporter, PiT family [Pseudooceanicola antarcticus]